LSMVIADACIGQFATVVIMAQCVSVLQFGQTTKSLPNFPKKSYNIVPKLANESVKL